MHDVCSKTLAPPSPSPSPSPSWHVRGGCRGFTFTEGGVAWRVILTADIPCRSTSVSHGCILHYTGSGIGAVIAEDLLALGCKVVIASRDEEKLLKAVSRLKSKRAWTTTSYLDTYLSKRVIFGLCQNKGAVYTDVRSLANITVLVSVVTCRASSRTFQQYPKEELQYHRGQSAVLPATSETRIK